MRILITPLQVSTSGSKGHLHPAIELALAAKRKGYEVAILPLPSRLGDQDRDQLANLKIDYLEPPLLPHHVIRPASELAQLAASPDKVHLAFSSFLLDPILHQYGALKEMIEGFKADLILFDLLVYSAPLLARELGIREAGYCAGLKLLAPANLLGTYIRVAHKLGPYRKSILLDLKQSLGFHYLEALSTEVNFVFSSEDMLKKDFILPPQTVLAGFLRPSLERGESFSLEGLPDKDFILLSFGSVLDPGDFREITNCIVKVAKNLDLKLIIASRKLRQTDFGKHVYVRSYLPLLHLIPRSESYIHHGGASSFNEGLFFGSRQMIIPLTTDQPIQGHYLQKSGAGICLNPEEVTEDRIYSTIQQLRNDKRIQIKAQELASSFALVSGADYVFKYL